MSVASDGELVGLYAVIKWLSEPWAVRIVGKTRRHFLCHCVQTDYPCILIPRTDLWHDIENDKTQVFVTESACLDFYEPQHLEYQATKKRKQKA